MEPKKLKAILEERDAKILAAYQQQNGLILNKESSDRLSRMCSRWEDQRENLSLTETEPRSMVTTSTKSR